jgi:molybdenum cofactor cytidylyltransferase
VPTGGLVLAAGAATRMGRLKQLLPYRGKTLVEHAVEQAFDAGFDPVAVVVGCEAAAVRAVLAAQSVLFVENPRWRLGMGSSIAAGMQLLGTLDEVAILLADQPRVESRHLREMQAFLYSAHASIVAAEYDRTLGVPAIFKHELFARLRSLVPEAGARTLLRDDPNFKVVAFPLPEAALDIDTPQDFEALNAII